MATDMISYLKQYEKKEICRFITCGSVDDGKSTLIGRLLYDNEKVFQDQLQEVIRDSKKYGTVGGGKIDWALFVDGLESEREQGITIDVAYCFFETERRKFIIADTPGHEQYTRNMATGASTADLAIIMIDARKGVLPQTKRHSYITALMGVCHIVVVINKMDLIDFSSERFEKIKKQYQNLIPYLPNHQHIRFSYIPLSALYGDNILSLSSRSSWYKGTTLIELLDTLEIQSMGGKERKSRKHFRFPVQYINRPHQNFRGICGTVVSGRIRVGEHVMVLPSGRGSKVKSIISSDIKVLKSKSQDEPVESVADAITSMAVTLTLEDDIDVSRGDLIVKSEDIPFNSDVLSVMVIWMSESPLRLENGYIIKRGSNILGGRFTHIEYCKNIQTLDEEKVDMLKINDIGRCVISLDRLLAVDPYTTNKYTGSFIIIDKYTNETLGAAMIVSCLSDSKSKNSRYYSSSEIALNRYIRQHFPEWDCKEIF